MPDFNNPGAKLLQYLGLQPWQAMAVQDRAENPSLIRVYVLDPNLDLAPLAAIHHWQNADVIFERSSPIALHA
ncbi:hypothetical protein [Methylobacterium tardum]|uniref:Uncharacterized protein n=1 Tax=Methylobacterium tardum TaxID=374432 RepID=A0AA37WQP3_9HYPH|nr:hypothetical protein [Methylobacterium tardum]URD34611.1 hypothetical protein M6G65_18620 [Methylobacterium tardum]GLS68067.1 hypothetical protein GCM10007890_00780 [Methylobacterium tardum]